MPLLGEGAGTAGAEIARKLGRSAPSFTLPACSQHISTNLQIETQRMRGVMLDIKASHIPLALLEAFLMLEDLASGIFYMLHRLSWDVNSSTCDNRAVVNWS